MFGGSMTYWSCLHPFYSGMENHLTFVTPTLLVSVNFSSSKVEFASNINLNKEETSAP